MRALVTALVALAALALPVRSQLHGAPLGEVVLNPAQWTFPPLSSVAAYLTPFGSMPDGYPMAAANFGTPYVSWYPNGTSVAFLSGFDTIDTAVHGVTSGRWGYHPNHGLTFILMYWAMPWATTQPLYSGADYIGPWMSGTPFMEIIVQGSSVQCAGWAPVSSACPFGAGDPFGPVTRSHVINGYPPGTAASAAGLSLKYQGLWFVPDEFGSYLAFLTEPITVTF